MPTSSRGGASAPKGSHYDQPPVTTPSLAAQAKPAGPTGRKTTYTFPAARGPFRTVTVTEHAPKGPSVADMIFQREVNAIGPKAVQQAANPRVAGLQNVLAAATGIPPLVKAVRTHNVPAAAADAAMLFPFGRVGEALRGGVAAVKAAEVVPRTAEEAAAHLAQASKTAAVEGHGAIAGSVGHAPRVQAGTITPATGGELGAQVRSALKGTKEGVPGAKEMYVAQKEEQSVARGDRAAAAEAATKKAGGGLEGQYAAKKALKGELPKIHWNNELVDLNQDTLDQMVRFVQDHPQLRPYEKISTVDALQKMTEGGIPTPSEVRLLERAFGKEATDTLRSAIGKGDVVRNLLNVPRAVMSSFDFSAPFRQGLVMAVSQPRTFAKAFGPMFKAWKSEEYFQRGIMDEIHSRPTYPLMAKAKVPFTEIGRDSSGVGQLNEREEAFMSNYAERIPGLGRFIRKSDRAYVGFLDRIRADAADNLFHAAAQQGLDLNDPHLLESIGNFVGSATGRGNLPALQNHVATLNAMFFSPRLMMSRLNFLGFGGEGLKSVVPGSYYMSLHPFARQQAWRALINLGATATFILGMARAAGAKVVTDPTNADFGKVKIGNTRFDILGGFQQYIRLGAELAERKVTSSTTGKPMPLGGGVAKTSILDILVRFARGKLAPVPSLLTDVAAQSTYTKQQLNPSDPKTYERLIVPRMVPFMAQDIWEALHTPNVSTGVKIIGPFADVFGVGMQSYAANKPKPRGGSSGNPYLQGVGGSGGSVYDQSPYGGGSSPYTQPAQP